MKARGVLVAVGAVVTGFVLTASPAQAALQTDFGSDAFVVTDSITVAEGESLGTVVVFEGPAVIEGSVENVVAFDGDVTIRGDVEDTVIAFSGRATVEAGGVVDGDVYSRPEPIVEDGGHVEGSTGSVNFEAAAGPLLIFSRLALWLAVSISTLALGALLLLLGPRAADLAVRTAREDVGIAMAAGFCTVVGLPLAALFAIVTLVGIPFGIGLLLGLFLIYAIGYVMSAWVLGRTVLRSSKSRMLSFLAGWGILRLVALVPILGGLAWFGATVFGLGVLLVEAWRARSPRSAEPAAPAAT